MNDGLGSTAEIIDGVKVEFIKGHATAVEARMIAVYAIKKGIIPDMTDEELERIPEHWTYGWKATIGKDQYGDYVRLLDPRFGDAHETLVKQARAVIKAKKP